MESNWEVPVIAFLIAACLAAIVYLSYQEGEKWGSFKLQHNCKVVAKVSGDILPTYSIGPNGQFITSWTTTPGKKGWLCDDGITYYR